MTEMTEGIIGRTVEGLARSRGYTSLKEVAGAVNATTGQDYTGEELVEWPRYGFGRDLDELLHFSEEEKLRLTRAVVQAVYHAREEE